MENTQKQVIFLFNRRDNTISEPFGDFDNVEDATREVKKLREKGLPAFFASEKYYRETKERR